MQGRTAQKYTKITFCVSIKVSSFTLSTRQIQLKKHLRKYLNLHDKMRINSSFLNRAFEAIYLHLFLKSSDGILWGIHSARLLLLLILLGKHLFPASVHFIYYLPNDTCSSFLAPVATIANKFINFLLLFSHLLTKLSPFHCLSICCL